MFTNIQNKNRKKVDLQRSFLSFVELETRDTPSVNTATFDVEGLVFRDNNGNGVRDTNDSGINNIYVSLVRYEHDLSSSVVLTRATNATGNFQLWDSNVISGADYKVQITEIPAGYEHVSGYRIGDLATNNDFYLSGGVVTTYFLGNSQDLQNIDAGFVPWQTTNYYISPASTPASPASPPASPPVSSSPLGTPAIIFAGGNTQHNFQGATAGGNGNLSADNIHDNKVVQVPGNGPQTQNPQSPPSNGGQQNAKNIKIVDGMIPTPPPSPPAPIVPRNHTEQKNLNAKEYSKNAYFQSTPPAKPLFFSDTDKLDIVLPNSIDKKVKLDSPSILTNSKTAVASLTQKKTNEQKLRDDRNRYGKTKTFDFYDVENLVSSVHTLQKALRVKTDNEELTSVDYIEASPYHTAKNTGVLLDDSMLGVQLVQNVKEQDNHSVTNELVILLGVDLAHSFAPRFNHRDLQKKLDQDRINSPFFAIELKK